MFSLAPVHEQAVSSRYDVHPENTREYLIEIEATVNDAGIAFEWIFSPSHLNETIYGTGIASSWQAHETKSGNFLNDDMLANVCKHHVTRFPYEISRLAQDLAGGLMVTLPSEQDFRDSETGPLLEKYLKGRSEVSTEDRMRILRLIENIQTARIPDCLPQHLN